ncbi:MAG: Uma2 family endonuclease [Steroidobacteraceae bacterium]|nr:Uma2 family endonuclease [Deltaproteobacteria bacterium]
MGNTAKQKKPYTYQEYQQNPADERMEIIDGEVYAMSPSPSVKHQKVVLAFGNIMYGFFKGKECTPFVAPMDVVLDNINVVEPDIFVVCDRSKITEANIQGAPDLIIEVLSPSTSLKDRREKKWLYGKHGVKEYIVVSPMDETAERFFLKSDGTYGESDIFGWQESFASKIFPDLIFDLRIIFEKEAVEVVAESAPPEWIAEKLKQSGVL